VEKRKETKGGLKRLQPCDEVRESITKRNPPPHEVTLHNEQHRSRGSSDDPCDQNSA
jgi:hypothetical protein